MTLHRLRKRLRSADPVLRTGRVCRIFSTHIEADGPNLPLGATCQVETQGGSNSILRAEVVRIDREFITLLPFEDGAETFSGAAVMACANGGSVNVGEALLGRAVDALGDAIDNLGTIFADEKYALKGSIPAALDRVSPSEVLETGIRAIDGLVTLGMGQRVGIFAASGVGKTTLLSQLMNQVEADITILCLVGERGREVEAIWNQSLDDAARERATLVAATSDQSAAMRVRAANYALALAEYWRDQGKHVLFLLDSVTRLAMAMREIGLAAGEPPTVRAYTPNVFAAIPKMIERCGALRSGGAISAIVTVLSETDDVDDPICELMKSLLDGHLVLSRTLAEQAHFPAIDIARSVSRQAENLIEDEQKRQALQILEWLSVYESSRTLINAGLYAKGSNLTIDRAIEQHPKMMHFLKQDRSERSDLFDTRAAIQQLAGDG
jgi:flagellum-specific ATP synthase